MKDTVMAPLQAPLECTNPSIPDTPLLSGEALSALVDGETDAQTWDAVWVTDGAPCGVHATWHRYHLIGDALRGGHGALGSVSALNETNAVGLARQVTGCVQSSARLPTCTAAKSSVFPWRMAAGFASFVVVFGFSWRVIGLSGQVHEPVLAVAPTATAPEPVIGNAVLWESTAQGQVLRDARLQELLQAHRQLGGVSALQVPAGFLRTSALDIHPH